MEVIQPPPKKKYFVIIIITYWYGYYSILFQHFFMFFFNIFICFQFVEIKGSLFKKIDKGFLFHISCSDVKERFLYIVLLAIVFIRNMTEFSWDPRKKLDIDTIDKLKWIYLLPLSKYLENLLYFCV